MWYEILPGFMIIAGAITFSGAGLKLIQYFECEGKVLQLYSNFSLLWISVISIHRQWDV